MKLAQKHVGKIILAVIVAAFGGWILSAHQQKIVMVNLKGDAYIDVSPVERLLIDPLFPAKTAPFKEIAKELESEGYFTMGRASLVTNSNGEKLLYFCFTTLGNIMLFISSFLSLIAVFVWALKHPAEE